jgi:hypothetical protein
MNNQITELIKQVNPTQLVIIGGMFWFFYSRLKAEIKDVRTEVKDLRVEVNTKYDKLNDKYDNLNNLILDLYKTLFKEDAA